MKDIRKKIWKPLDREFYERISSDNTTTIKRVVYFRLFELLENLITNLQFTVT